ncbi:MAG: SGNH/GDSL hydrolase family protein [Bryobacteraceae bacterium]
MKGKSGLWRSHRCSHWRWLGVFYGSSSIRLWDTIAADLESPGIVNRGFGGSTLEACGHFFERLVAPLRPRSLIVYAGDNDLGDGRSAEQVSGYFQELFTKVDLHLGPIPFGFISIKPSPARFGIIGSIARANAEVRARMASRPNSYYIDVFEPMLDRHRRPRVDLFLADGLHLSRAGYLIWTEQLLPFRKRLFIEQQSDSNTFVLRSEEREARVSQVAQQPAEP